MNSPSRNTLGQTEFILLVSMMFSAVAFAIDSMLPAMPQIAQDLNLSNNQFAPYIILAFMVGLGAGTFIAGPLSDAFGRRPLVFIGLAIYIAGAILSAISPSLELMLAARLLQGLGAAGPRVVSAAITRDLYSGRDMARIMSLTIMVFLTMPALAPMLGAEIQRLAGWRSIFVAFVVFALMLVVWFGMRQPETLAPADRRPLRVSLLQNAVREMFEHPVVRLSIIAQTLLMGAMFSLLTMVQPIFDITFGRAESFPYWFGATAVVSASASYLNSRLVVRVGMRKMITLALGVQMCVTALCLAGLMFKTGYGFGIYVVWQTFLLMMGGLTTANLNAVAAEPMGHIAGMAASIIGGVATVGGALIGFGSALLFDGTARPLLGLTLVLVALAYLAMAAMRRAEGRLSAAE